MWRVYPSTGSLRNHQRILRLNHYSSYFVGSLINKRNDIPVTPIINALTKKRDDFVKSWYKYPPIRLPQTAMGRVASLCKAFILPLNIFG